MDLKDALKELTDDIQKFLFTIEFSKLNDTKVEVPATVKNNSTDLNSLMEEPIVEPIEPVTNLF